MSDSKSVLERTSRAGADDVVSLSGRGHSVNRPLIRSMAATEFIALSTATPQVSPSPWRQWPSSIENSAPRRSRQIAIGSRAKRRCHKKGIWRVVYAPSRHFYQEVFRLWREQQFGL